MKRYIGLYYYFLQVSLSVFLSDRIRLISGIFSSIIWSTLVITIMVVLTSRSAMVAGWTRDELLLLSATYNMFFGIHYFLFNINFRKLSHIISSGELDTVLTKPIDTQFLLCFQQVDYTELTRTLFGMGMVGYVIVNMHMHISFISLLTGSILLLFSLCITYTVWFAILTLTIWLPHLSNLRDLLYALNGISRFPPQMFRNASNILFFALFPLTLVIVVPVKALLQKASSADILLVLFFSFFLVFLSRQFWKFALRFYTSAGG